MTGANRNSHTPKNTTIPATVWSDVRFEILAQVLDVDRYSAIGRYARLLSMADDGRRVPATAAATVLGAGTRRKAFAVLEESGLGYLVSRRSDNDSGPIAPKRQFVLATWDHATTPADREPVTATEADDFFRSFKFD